MHGHKMWERWSRKVTKLRPKQEGQRWKEDINKAMGRTWKWVTIDKRSWGEHEEVHIQRWIIKRFRDDDMIYIWCMPSLSYTHVYTY